MFTFRFNIYSLLFPERLLFSRLGKYTALESRSGSVFSPEPLNKASEWEQKRLKEGKTEKEELCSLFLI